LLRRWHCVRFWPRRQTAPTGLSSHAAAGARRQSDPQTGASATYIVRQLNDMKTEARSGVSTALMKAVVDKLSVEDMIAIAAYLGSRDP